MTETALDRLARLYHIEPGHSDASGRRVLVSARTKIALLKAVGVAIEKETEAQAILAQHEAQRWRRPCDPVQVAPEGAKTLQVLIRLPEERREERFEWTVVEEKGQRRSGYFVPEGLAVNARAESGGIRFAQWTLTLDAPPTPGYHRLEIRDAQGRDDGNEIVAAMRLIVAPKICYVPAGLKENTRAWGPAVQLFALTSVRNWGVGDFTDLKDLVDFCGDEGAGILRVGPLHSLFPARPERANPYAPSNRWFYNLLYLDVEAASDFETCEEARLAVQSPEFQARLAGLRHTELVDYEKVWTAKLPILERLYQHFRKHHLEPQTHQGQAFRVFQAAGGERLHQCSLFDALEEHLQRETASRGARDWRQWPKPYRSPHSKEVAEFAAAHKDRIEFFQYLQWHAHRQMEQVGHRAMARGLKVGLCETMAPGVAIEGCEAWSCQDIYPLDVVAGEAAYGHDPQSGDRGCAPPIPGVLAEKGYEPFIAALRASMRHSGALCLEQFMGLSRLFWTPGEAEPAEGAYVSYPFDDLLGVLALESRRNRCLVIAKSAETIPAAVRSALDAMGILTHHLLYSEKAPQREFKRPAAIPETAALTVSEHDRPTLTGYWHGADLTAKAKFGLFASGAAQEAQILERAEDRIRLLFALRQEGLLPEKIAIDTAFAPKMSPDLMTAIHAYAARSPSKILLFQPEDALGQIQQAFLAGAPSEHPNWRHKLSAPIEAFAENAAIEALLAALRFERGRGVMPTPSAVLARESIPGLPSMPIATYRLQFNGDFTFSAATQIVPYLRRLGISHCYASPYLKARPGSTHGYDIVDHSTINPELGTAEDFEDLVRTLHEHGMGQILDMVPNHMAAGCDNRWWADILENGQASAYADFFDIAWNPLQDELRGKVLVPILEDHYGLVLEKGLLRLAFDRKSGEFRIWYRDNPFPVDPGSYPLILRHGLERLESRLGASDAHFLEFHSLITGFENLPAHGETARERKTARRRNQEVHKRQLSRICQACKDIERFVEENVFLFNGAADNSRSFDSLHQLLQVQPYRLAFWRVASDNINYRRFFDINELGALRMQRRDVFEETHRFALALLAQRTIQGLRIDHIDGLQDPAQYCRRLREEWQKAESSAAGTGQKGIPSGETPSETPSETQEEAIYMIVEKILAVHESLPADWPVHGTTGYEFANLVGGLFVDPARESEMTRIYSRFIGYGIDFDELLYNCKKLIIKVAMASELGVLANALTCIAESRRYTRDFTLNSLRDALTEVVACFPVYRTYVTGDRVSEEDRQYVERAVAQARKRSQAADVTIYYFIHDVLLLNAVEEKDLGYRRSVVEFTMQFQQFTGPVMAKGLEDTSFYIYNRLLSLNEVGGEPRRFGVTVPAFHDANRRRALQWPHSMLSTSTHDTKRSEDVRARISVLAEIPAQWKARLARWTRLNRARKRIVDENPAPSSNDEYALYQTLVGAWPLRAPSPSSAPAEGNEMSRFLQRIEGAAIKAVKEAKEHSSWINPNKEYEDAVTSFVRHLLHKPEANRFVQDFAQFQALTAWFGMFNSLSMTLLKLTSPGVPDIYQGNEVWNFTLVDPDNRRPVDFAARQGMLEDLQAAFDLPDERLTEAAHRLTDTMEDGRIKLYVTWKTLSLRWACRDVFQGQSYIPLPAYGSKAEHLCAFAREGKNHRIIAAAPRLCATLCGGEDRAKPLGETAWLDTGLELVFGSDGRPYRNVFTGERLVPDLVSGQARLRAADLFKLFPVALLVDS